MTLTEQPVGWICSKGVEWGGVPSWVHFEGSPDAWCLSNCVGLLMWAAMLGSWQSPKVVAIPGFHWPHFRKDALHETRCRLRLHGQSCPSRVTWQSVFLKVL